MHTYICLCIQALICQRLSIVFNWSTIIIHWTWSKLHKEKKRYFIKSAGGSATFELCTEFLHKNLLNDKHYKCINLRIYT